MVTAAVLSGGGSLGAVQVGMLLALADHHVVPDVLVGTSVGAINAGFLAGHTGPGGLEELARIWTRLTRHDIFPTGPARLLRAAAGRETGFADPKALRRLVENHLTYRRLEMHRGRSPSWPRTSSPVKKSRSRTGPPARRSWPVRRYRVCFRPSASKVTS